MLIGDWEGWYTSGKPNYKGKYNDKGKKQGEWLYWFENGTFREKANFVNGIKHGNFISYYEKGGFVDTEGKYRKGHQNGTWKYYFETGGLLKTQSFKNGHLSGKCVTYYQNNTIQSTSNYKVVADTRKGKRTTQSLPDGDWIFYDKNGKEISRIHYDEGVKK